MLKMRHPNIVLFMGSCINDTKLYMVTELLKNGSIYALYKSGRVLDAELTQVEFCINVGIDGSKGMQYLHTLNPPLIHR